MARVLVAEDESGVRSFLRETLERAGHDVVDVADGDSALSALRDGDGFDVVLTDLRMPGADGMTVVRTARTIQPDAEVIVLTAFGSIPSAVEALKLGAFDYLEKPVAGPAAVRELVEKALSRRALFGENSTRPLPGGHSSDVRLTWGSPAMAPVVSAIEKVAPTRSTVLLLGDSGTGKEVVARAIHTKSPRASRPFVAINCAVLSPNLLDSELFGHEKGAFTGAHTLRRGRLELADSGTFFLDEIGELHVSLQAKLLRVLEERRFERVGGQATVAVDVRILAATNRDLRAMIREGTFREDLYHRLAVFPIRVPKLSERRDDIVPMAQTILRELARAGGRKEPTLTPEAKGALTRAPWSGNVRELRNVLERALIVSSSNEIDAGVLAIEPAEVGADVVSGTRSLEAIEKEAIAEALATVGGNRKDAAARLGIGLRTLYDKLKRYGM